MLLTDNRGRQHLTGYVGKFLHTFAAVHNGSLRLPLGISNLQPHNIEGIQKAVKNGSIDIGATIYRLQAGQLLQESSYPLEITAWSVATPLEPPMPTKTLLVLVFRIEIIILFITMYGVFSILLAQNTGKSVKNRQKITLSDLTCNLNVLRGLLGLVCQMKQELNLLEKYAYFLVFLTGIFISTTISGNLAKLLTNPPILQHIRDFEYFLKNQKKILLHSSEIFDVQTFRGMDFWQKYKAIFVITTSLKEFLSHRIVLDASYAYPITKNLWQVLKLKQKHFSRPAFFTPPELNICDYLLLSMPIAENSFYREPLLHMILNLNDAGISAHWSAMSYYFLLEVGRLTIPDESRNFGPEPFSFEDLQWIWMFYCISITISLLVFCLEKLCFKLKQRTKLQNIL